MLGPPRIPNTGKQTTAGEVLGKPQKYGRGYCDEMDWVANDGCVASAGVRGAVVKRPVRGFRWCKIKEGCESSGWSKIYAPLPNCELLYLSY